MWGPALAIGGASLVSGLLGSDAAEDAANAQTTAAKLATDAQASTFAATSANLAPYMGVGKNALQHLMWLLGTGPETWDSGAKPGASTPKPVLEDIWKQHEDAHMQQFGVPIPGGRDNATTKAQVEAAFNNKMKEWEAGQMSSTEGTQPLGEYGSLTKEFESLMKGFSLEDFQKSPGYQFRLGEGEKALTRNAAARGMLKSSAGLKSLMQFNQDFASSEFDSAWGKYMAENAGKFGILSNKVNILQTLANSGQNAAAMTGSAGAAAASGIANSIIQGGNAAAMAGMTGASSINNAIQGGLGNMMYMNRWNQQMDLYNKMVDKNGVLSYGSGSGMNWNNTGGFGTSPTMG